MGVNLSRLEEIAKEYWGWSKHKLKRCVEVPVYFLAAKYGVAILFGRYFSFRLEGEKNLINGPAILVINHVTGIDHFLLGHKIKRQIHYIADAAAAYPNWRMAIGMWASGMIPVGIDERSTGEKVIKRTSDYLRWTKDYIGVFDGSTKDKRDENGKLIPLEEVVLHNSAAHFAIKHHVPIIPVRLSCSYDVSDRFLEWGGSLDKLDDLRRYTEENGFIGYHIKICAPIFPPFYDKRMFREHKEKLTGYVKRALCS